MSRYAELHCHSNFSFLDGASHPYALVERAVALGYEALAITDHDGFYGAPRFRLAAVEAGLATVYGVEVGLARDLAPVAPRPSPVGGLPAPRTPLPAREDGHDRREAGSGKREARHRGRTHRLHGTKPIALPPP